MIDRGDVEQMIAQYTKHGWKLRRVLLSVNADELGGVFGDAEIRGSDLDAAWFSRASKPDVIAWELRSLARTPYALVTGVPVDAGEDEAEVLLAETEAKMLETQRHPHR